MFEFIHVLMDMCTFIYFDEFVKSSFEVLLVQIY